MLQKRVKIGPNTYQIRQANPGDAATIAAHRQRMFVEHPRAREDHLAGMTLAFSGWLRRKLRGGRYVGWFAESDGEIVAGIGVFLVERPPRAARFGRLRGYVVNAFTEPAHRGSGVDKFLLRLAERCARAERPDDNPPTARSFTRRAREIRRGSSRGSSFVTPGAGEATRDVDAGASSWLASTTPPCTRPS